MKDTKTDTKNVILYCRVSTDEQADGCSLDVQEQRLRAYCLAHNYNVVDEVRREDYSAKHYDLKRPEMKSIYEYCKKHRGKVDKILFLRWDRYSRNVEFAFAYKRKFYDELNIEINSIESPIDFTGTEWSTMLALYCGVAHTEDEKISKRVKDGIREHLKKGHWCNHAPRGYKHERHGLYKDHDTKMVIDENTSPLIRHIFKEVAKGTESANSIRKRLCPEIARSSFMQMLHNILYIGKIKVPACGNEEEEIVDGQHQPLIDEETFYQVQDLIEGRNHRKHTLIKGKKPHPDFYLRGYIICPMCGKPITASFSHGNGGKYPYYHCMCSPRHYNVRAEKVNGEFVRYVRGLKPDEGIMNVYNSILLSIREDNNYELKKRIKELEERKLFFENRKKRVKEDYWDKKIEWNEYNENVKEIDEDIQKLQKEIEGVRTIIRTNLNPMLDYSISLINNLERYFDDAPIEIKQRLLGSFFPEKVEFDGKSFRTTKYNAVLDLIYNETSQLRGIKKDNSDKLSYWVAGEGFEPTTSGL